jgi:hypothetical protein
MFFNIEESVPFEKIVFFCFALFHFSNCYFTFYYFLLHSVSRFQILNDNTAKQKTSRDTTLHEIALHWHTHCHHGLKFATAATHFFAQIEISRESEFGVLHWHSICSLPPLSLSPSPSPSASLPLLRSLTSSLPPACSRLHASALLVLPRAHLRTWLCFPSDLVRIACVPLTCAGKWTYHFSFVCWTYLNDPMLRNCLLQSRLLLLAIAHASLCHDPCLCHCPTYLRQMRNRIREYIRC